MKVFFNDEAIEIDHGTTLRGLATQRGKLDRRYVINGEVPAHADVILQNLAVIDEKEAGILVGCNGSGDTVEVQLTDFRGASGSKRVPKFIAEFETEYNQPVKVSVIRNSQVAATDTLRDGDRVMVTPAGGVKGA